MSRIPESLKIKVEYHLKKGESVRQIASRYPISPTSVQRIRDRIADELETNKGGRPRVFTDQDRRHFVRYITSGEAETASEVVELAREELGLEVSRDTVARSLKSYGLESGEKEEKPALSAKNIKARLAFAMKYRYWTIEDWKRVIWSDETKINRFSSDGRSWYWAREGTSLQPNQVKQKYKGGGGHIMIWGCMTASGVGYMCKIDGNMNAELYKRILEDELLNTIEYYELDRSKVIFQHDNDPKHTSKTVREWLTEHEFEVLDWPPQSSDLNPIEHLWAHLKNRLNKYDGPANGMIQLWERVQEQWNMIDGSFCMGLIETMPERIKAVIEAQGKWTEY